MSGLSNHAYGDAQIAPISSHQLLQTDQLEIDAYVFRV